MQKLNLKLISLVVIVGATSLSAESAEQKLQNKVLQSFLQMLMRVSSTSKEFLSLSNKESMPKHVEHFKKLKDQSVEKLKELRQEVGNQEHLLELISYAEVMLQEFVRFIAIIDEFKNKGQASLTALGKKLSENIDPRALLMDSMNKIENLRLKYQGKNKEFSDALGKFVESLKPTVLAWEKFGTGNMLNGLCYRLSIR